MSSIIKGHFWGYGFLGVRFFGCGFRGAVFEAARRQKTVALKTVPPVIYEELQYVGVTLNCRKIIRGSEYLSIAFQ